MIDRKTDEFLDNSDSYASFCDFIERTGGFGYFDPSKETINLFEIPDIQHLLNEKYSDS